MSVAPQEPAARGREDREPYIPESAMPKPVGLDVAALADKMREGPLKEAMRRVREDPAAADAEAAAAEAEARAELAAAQRRNRYAAYTATRPADYEDSSYERLLPQQDDNGKVRGWWRSGHRTLLLAGLPAKGKTDAAYAICNEVARDALEGRTAPVQVRSVRVVDLIEVLRPPAVHEARDETLSARRSRVIADVAGCDLLLLDDLTAVKVSDYVRQELYRLLDARVNDPSRRTIVTANAAEKADLGRRLEEFVGSPVVSRLRKGCVAAWIEGDDLRKFATWDPFV